MMEGARVILEVVAGVIPEQPMNEYTRRFAITLKEWEETEDKAFLLATRNGAAMGYFNYLSLQPGHLNWVRLDSLWLWL